MPVVDDPSDLRPRRPVPVTAPRPASRTAGAVLAGPPAASVLVRQAAPWSTLVRLPADRTSRTRAFTLGGASGTLTAGLYPDGRLGEVFVVLGRPGSTLAGLMGAFSVCVSLSLQHGVPLQTWVERFINMRFEPAGRTDDPDIPLATSLVDYMFRRLALDHLDYPVRAGYGILTAAERSAATVARTRGPEPGGQHQ